MRITILPVGEVAADVLQIIWRGLRKVFPEIEVEVSEAVMLIPREVYNLSRRQYHSTRILARMDSYAVESEIQRVLGVTEVDLYVPGLNFVFGEAQYKGKVALISLFRLRTEFYGEPSDRGIFYERAVKEAVHEVGHLVGVGHCSNSLCVMHFSNSIESTDKKQASFCDDCHVLVHRVLEK